jgi:acetoin utilization deacetylase AcuC-like enzyme
MTDSTAIVFSDYSKEHDTGSHPENQARLTSIHQRLQRGGYFERHTVYQTEPIDPARIIRVHDEFLIEIVRALADRGGGFIDADTYVSGGSYRAALASAGAAVQAVDLVLTGTHPRSFSMTRPPGHHAERKRQLGFCLFNNIAVAATHALDEYELNRIAIIDWDVHHGNGTQDIFYNSSHVLFCSVHQWPLFPGTGLNHERGVGPGEGFTINVPLPPGSGEPEYCNVFDDVFAPSVDAFKPDLIMASAGFDAHRDDPLAMMELGDRGFSRLARRVKRWADKLCDGRLVLVLEGGYNLRALADSVVAVLDTLDSPGQNERDIR